jgi:hypothetical protein
VSQPPRIGVRVIKVPRQQPACAGLASEAKILQERPGEIRTVEKGNLPDGMESLFDGSAGLRFARDKRMLEVRALSSTGITAARIWRTITHVLAMCWRCTFNILTGARSCLHMC